MHTLYEQLDDGRWIAFVSLDGKELQNLFFTSPTYEVVKVTGINRTINTKDVNRFLSFIGLELEKQNNKVNKDLCRNFIRQMLTVCDNSNIDYEVPEIVSYLLNEWI